MLAAASASSDLSPFDKVMCAAKGSDLNFSTEKVNPLFLSSPLRSKEKSVSY